MEFWETSLLILSTVVAWLFSVCMLAIAMKKDPSAFCANFLVPFSGKAICMQEQDECNLGNHIRNIQLTRVGQPMISITDKCRFVPSLLPRDRLNSSIYRAIIRQLRILKNEST